MPDLLYWFESFDSHGDKGDIPLGPISSLNNTLDVTLFLSQIRLSFHDLVDPNPKLNHYHLYFWLDFAWFRRSGHFRPNIGQVWFVQYDLL